MTGNQIKGKGFKGALRYNLEKVEKKVAEVLDHNFVEVSEKRIMKEILMVRALRPNLQKFFYHTSINFPPNENISSDLMKQIGNDYMVGSGFTQHQFIMFRHLDADHPHLHILVNRIDFDGKVLSDSNDFQRSEKVLRELEKKYNLTKVLSSREAKERAMTKDELEMMKRTNQPSGKLALQEIVRSVLHSGRRISTADFVEGLEDKGVTVLFNQAKTGYVSGISYSYKGFVSTGAKLGKDFKWTSIKNNIDYEQERDRATIHQANTRSRSVHPNAAAGSAHHSGDSASVRQGRTKLKSILDQSKDSQSHNSGSSDKGSDIKQSARSTQRQDVNNGSLLSEKPKSFDLASLLDSHSRGDHYQPDHQPDLGNPHLKRKRRKRRHRKRM